MKGKTMIENYHYEKTTSMEIQPKVIHRSLIDGDYMSHRDRQRGRIAPRIVRQHVCPFCGRIFNERGNLQVHIRIHTNERPFYCRFPGCQKNFTTIGNRNDHERRHTKDKPYKCTCNPGVCFAEYYRKYQLTRHINSKHRGQNRGVIRRCHRSPPQRIQPDHYNPPLAFDHLSKTNYEDDEYRQFEMNMTPKCKGLNCEPDNCQHMDCKKKFLNNKVMQEINAILDGSDDEPYD